MLIEERLLLVRGRKDVEAEAAELWSYTEEFKRDAVKRVTEQGYSLSEAAWSLGVHVNRLRGWKQKFEAEETKYEAGLTEDERMELARLRAENKRLRMERDILKEAAAFFAKFGVDCSPWGSAMRGV